MEQIGVFIVDDHKLFVEGICSLLSDERRFKIIGCASSGYELLERVIDEEIDVFLVDLNMPDMSGVELTRRLKERNKFAKVLALTMHDDFEYVEKMIKSGANGYVLKSASLTELTTAIEQVALGKRFFGEAIQEMMFSRIGGVSETRDELRDHAPNLTKREIEILSLIVKEYTNAQIADMLFISERTVETHRKNIFSKTKVKTVIGLSKFALKHGLASFDNGDFQK